MQLCLEEKTPAQVFSCKVSEIFNLLCRTCPNECLSEMNQKSCIPKSYSQENTGDGVLFSAVADEGLQFFQERLHHICFSMKTVKFYRILSS